jgi:p-cumate 2,3-dioxygenase subunit alpha
MMPIQTHDPAVLIDDRPEDGIFRVHRSSMTSPAVLELERERIFGRTWLYVGHESEVAQPGEHRAREVGCRPVLLLRDPDGQVRCLLASCPQCGAGATVVPGGAIPEWRCNRQECGSVTTDATRLEPVARLESYRGFWFANFSPATTDLVTYLAGATEYFDLVVDQSEVGMRVLHGSQEFALRANWKLYVENSFDIYHALPVHQTYFSYLASRGGGVGYHGRHPGRARALGNGHASAELEASYARPIARWDPTFGEESREEIAAIRSGLVDRFGEERAFRMADTIRLMVVFPNFVLDDIPAITLRSINPVRPDYTIVRSWALAPVEESDRLLKRRLESFLTFIGPGGFATPDDVESVESCQMGFAAAEVEWSDISRGVHRSPNLADDELQMQTFWRGWADAMRQRPDR